MKVIKFFLFITVQIAFTQSLAWARWVQDGPALNINVNEDAQCPSLANFNGTPYASWSESNGTAYQIYIKHWNGMAWVLDGSSLNVNTSLNATTPSLKICNGTPYIAWAEANHIYEKHWNGTGWQQDGNSLNANVNQTASNPSLAVYNNTPYVAWTESNGAATQIYVKHWNGIAWLPDGSSLNIDASQNASFPSLAVEGGTPYAAWEEYNPTIAHDMVHIKYGNIWVGGISWVQMGDCVVNTNNYFNITPSLAVYNQVPYIALNQIFYGVSGGSTPSPSIYMAHWSQNAWQPDANAGSGGAPSLSIYNGVPYVAVLESVNIGSKPAIMRTQVFEKHWNGNNWAQDGITCLNISNSQNAINPSLAIYNGTPYVAWSESNGSVNQIYVKHWVPETLSRIETNYKITGSTVQVSVYSANFNGTPAAKLIRGGDTTLNSASTTQNSPYNYTYTFNLSGATPDVYDAVVTTDNYQGSLKQAFTVLSPLNPPVVWNVLDLGAAGGVTATANYCGLAIGDGDQDNTQELYTASLDQSLYQFKKYSYGWQTATALPVFTGANFSRVILSDGAGDQYWEIYGASYNNHVYQFQGPAYTPTDLGAGPTGANKILALAQADLDHDGVPEIYAAGDNGAICQYANTGTAWSTTNLAGPGYQAMVLVSGDGNNDFAMELYSANADKNIYQYQYSGAIWQLTSITGGTVGTGLTYGLAVGDGDNDGQNEIYAANQDGTVYQCRWNGAFPWAVKSIGNPGGGPMYAVAISDGENNGTNQVYAACGNGHVYEFKYQSGNWIPSIDLGTANTALYALAIGDADNDHNFEIYALGQNNHVFQFKAFSQATPTPTATATSVPITPTITPTPLPPKNFFKIYHSQINPLHDEQARIVWTQPQAGPVTITIYNILGDKIIALADNQNYPAEQYNEIKWNGRSNKGNIVGSGIYLVVLQAGGRRETGKAAVVK